MASRRFALYTLRTEKFGEVRQGQFLIKLRAGTAVERGHHSPAWVGPPQSFGCETREK